LGLSLWPSPSATLIGVRSSIPYETVGSAGGCPGSRSPCGTLDADVDSAPLTRETGRFRLGVAEVP